MSGTASSPANASSDRERLQRLLSAHALLAQLEQRLEPIITRPQRKLDELRQKLARALLIDAVERAFVQVADAQPTESEPDAAARSCLDGACKGDQTFACSELRFGIQ
jgi:DNA-binding transcriptional regulator/RsmH inhibitor MraZ